MKITILTAPDCKECQLAKRIVKKAVEEEAGIEVESVDVLEDPVMAAKFHIISVPAILIDGKLEFTRVPKKEELIRKLSEYGYGKG